MLFRGNSGYGSALPGSGLFVKKHMDTHNNTPEEKLHRFSRILYGQTYAKDARKTALMTFIFFTISFVIPVNGIALAFRFLAILMFLRFIEAVVYWYRYEK